MWNKLFDKKCVQKHFFQGPGLQKTIQLSIQTKQISFSRKKIKEYKLILKKWNNNLTYWKWSTYLSFFSSLYCESFVLYKKTLVMIKMILAYHCFLNNKQIDLLSTDKTKLHENMPIIGCCGLS